MSTDTSDGSCLNCGAALAGDFCRACGQAASTRRLTFGALLADVGANLLSLDAKVPRTFVGLTRKPGLVCREYVDGRRARYVSPFRYWLTAVALLVLWNAWLDFDPAGSTPDLTGGNEAAQQVRALVAGFVMRHLDLVSAAVLPLFVLVLWILFLRARRPEGSGLGAGARFGYAEVSAFGLFVMGHLFLADLVVGWLRIASPGAFVLVKIALSIAFLAWAARDFFRQSIARCVVKSVVAIVAYYLLISVVVLVVLLPQLVELMRAGMNR